MNEYTIPEGDYVQTEKQLEDAGIEPIKDRRSHVAGCGMPDLSEWAYVDLANYVIDGDLDTDLLLDAVVNSCPVKGAASLQIQIYDMEMARVQPLLETGKRPSEITDILNVNPSTITCHKTRADEWLNRAELTVENVAEKGVEVIR